MAEALGSHAILVPVVALVAWSLIMLIWLYATRMPAMRKAGIGPQEGAHARDLNARMPAHPRQVADNYNHLMEQPTIFYAICFALQFLDQTQPINIGLAWSYVVLRVAHSLVQCTINYVPLRFALFVLSTLALAAMSVHAALAMWG